LWILFLFESKSYCYSKIYDNRACYQGLDNFIFHFSLFGYQQDKADDEASRKERRREHYTFLEIIAETHFYFLFILTSCPLFLKTQKLINPTIMTATPIDAVSGDGAVRRIAIPIIIVMMLEE
jgi:hypothetical protein